MIRAALCLAALALASPAAAGEEADRLFGLIAERLSLMEPVAAWKAARGAPVEDLAREAVVLEKATAGAADRGLDPDTIRPFFEAQIGAAKDIQWCWIDRWESGAAAPPAEPPDLVEDIRPELIRLGDAILSALRARLAGGPITPAEQAGFADAVAIECLGEEARDGVFAALTGVRMAE